MRRGLGLDRTASVAHNPRTGLPVVTLGTVITTEDVRSIDDES